MCNLSITGRQCSMGHPSAMGAKPHIPLTRRQRPSALLPASSLTLGRGSLHRGCQPARPTASTTPTYAAQPRLFLSSGIWASPNSKAYGLHYGQAGVTGAPCQLQLPSARLVFHPGVSASLCCKSLEAHCRAESKCESSAEPGSLAQIP